MHTNCAMCGGLLKFTPLRINPHEKPRPPYAVEALFQLEVKCEDCGRTTTYDCIKPGNIGLPKDPDVHWGEPVMKQHSMDDDGEALFDHTKYDAVMDKLHRQKYEERRRRSGLLNLPEEVYEPLSDEPTDAVFRNRAMPRDEQVHWYDPDDVTDAEFAGENLCEDPDNVIEFTGVTRHDLPPERILNFLDRSDIMEIVAVGFLEDGSEFFASSKADGAAALWHLMRAQHKLMTQAEGE